MNQYIIRPTSPVKAATHKNAAGILVHIVTLPAAAKVLGTTPLTDIAGYTPVTLTPGASAPAVLTKAKTAAITTVTNAYNALSAGIALPDPSDPSGTGTITLAATTADRANFTELTTHLNNAGASAPATVTISDAKGVFHTLTHAQFKALMVAYGAACLTAWTNWQTQIAQIQQQQNVANVNLIA